MGAGKSLNGREEIRANFLCEFFLAHVDFFLPPLTAPGSPRMGFSLPVKLFFLMSISFTLVNTVLSLFC